APKNRGHAAMHLVFSRRLQSDSAIDSQRRNAVRPLARAKPLQSRALSTVVSALLTLVTSFSLANSEPAAPSAAKQKASSQAKKGSSPTRQIGSASAKEAGSSSPKHRVPVPKERPVARHTVPPTVRPAATTAPARELASPSLPPPIAAPAPAARQRVTIPTPAQRSVTPAAVAATSSTS